MFKSGESIQRKMREGVELELNEGVEIRLREPLDPSKFDLLKNDMLLTVTECTKVFMRIGFALNKAVESEYFPKSELKRPKKGGLSLARHPGQSIAIRIADGVSVMEAAEDLDQNGILVAVFKNPGDDMEYPRVHIYAGPCWKIVRLELTSLRIPTIQSGE